MSVEFKFVPLTFISTKEAIEVQLKNTILFKKVAEKYSNYIQLGELIHSTQYGFTASAKETGTHKLLRITDINNGSVNWNNVPSCDCDREKNYLLSTGDVLIARTGNNISYMVDKEVPNNAVFASYLIRIVCDEEKILPEYLYLFLNSYAFWPQILLKQRGALLQNVNANLMRQLLIPMCPIKVQRELLDNVNNSLVYNIEIERKKISSLFNLKVEISNELTHQLTLVKKLRQQLLQDAVQGKLVEQNPNDEPASELLKKIKAEKAKLIAEKKLKKEKELPAIKPEEIPFEIPENWMWCRLGDLAFTANNGLYKPESFYKESGYISLRMFNIQEGEIKLDKVKRVVLDQSELTNYLLEENDILVNRVNSKELVGKAALIRNVGEPLVFESMNIRLRLANKQQLAPYINQILLEKRARFYFYSSAKVANGQVSINQTQLYELLIPLPPLAEQNRIVQKLDELMQYCNELEASIKQSESQNEKLLQQVLREALRKEPSN